MSLPKIYTLGYHALEEKTGTELLRIAQALDAIVTDCREDPTSNVPTWQKRFLKIVLKERYFHFPPFGNKKYQAGIIDIADYKQGANRIKNSPKDLILLCACATYETCHLKYLAARLTADGFHVEPAPTSRQRRFKF